METYKNTYIFRFLVKKWLGKHYLTDKIKFDQNILKILNIQIKKVNRINNPAILSTKYKSNIANM